MSYDPPGLGGAASRYLAERPGIRVAVHRFARWPNVWSKMTAIAEQHGLRPPSDHPRPRGRHVLTHLHRIRSRHDVDKCGAKRPLDAVGERGWTPLRAPPPSFPLAVAVPITSPGTATPTRPGGICSPSTDFRPPTLGRWLVAAGGRILSRVLIHRSSFVHQY